MHFSHVMREPAQRSFCLGNAGGRMPAVLFWGYSMKQFFHAGLAVVMALAVGFRAVVGAEDDSRPIVPSAPPDLTRPHPSGVHDMVRMQRVGEPVPSPDGKWI